MNYDCEMLLLKLLLCYSILLPMLQCMQKACIVERHDVSYHVVLPLSTYGM